MEKEVTALRGAMGSVGEDLKGDNAAAPMETTGVALIRTRVEMAVESTSDGMSSLCFESLNWNRLREVGDLQNLQAGSPAEVEAEEVFLSMGEAIRMAKEVTGMTHPDHRMGTQVSYFSRYSSSVL